MGRKATKVYKKYPYVKVPEVKENKTSELEKKLINLVKDRPALFDPRYPEEERTKQARQILWEEVSQGLEGQLSAADAESRWKYFRTCFITARNQYKVKEEIARRTGTWVPAAGRSRDKKYSFRYYEYMEFLEDSVSYMKGENQRFALNKELQKLPAMPNIIKKVIPIAPKPPVIQVNNPDIQANLVAANSVDNVSPFTFVHLPSASSSQNSPQNDVASTKSNSLKVTDYDKIFLECLQRPIEQPSPIDGFLIRLGEGLKKLPYRERSKLELEFLQRLYQVEEQLENEN